MTLISSNGWQFDCAITGEGQDLVFIHGEIHGASYWENQVKEFSKDHRCFIYDRRGHNGTGAPSFGYSLENLLSLTLFELCRSTYTVKILQDHPEFSHDHTSHDLRAHDYDRHALHALVDNPFQSQ